uniref:Histidine phosphatase family protein n=1 Tax=Panagrellus redivivus TaxID=6233 RepID=A0A7E4VUS1_PANRE
MVRTIYIIRHAERIDNVDSQWRKKTKNAFSYDNSPLSTRGHQQCTELNRWFKDIHVDHVFASPFDRTLDTATRMIGDRNIPIKPEGGFLEALYLCESPPGVRPLEVLKETYPLIDTSYKPVVNPWKGGFKPEGVGDDACTPRVRKALNNILDNYDGDIAIVSHGAPTGALLEIMLGRWTYVGQATVSTIQSPSPGEFEAISISNADHLSDKRNLRPW